MNMASDFLKYNVFIKILISSTKYLYFFKNLFFGI